LIEFQNLYKIYSMGSESVHAIDGVSLRNKQRRVLAIVGQSGSGKSTCMNIMGCLDVPTKGRYLLAGRDVGRMNDDDLPGYATDMSASSSSSITFLPKLSVMENVEVSMLYAGVARKEREERARAVLERVGLTDKLKNMPNQLSGGQQQRVSIARALAGRPSVILADEPTGALDSKTGQDVLRLLEELNTEGNTIVLITHDPTRRLKGAPDNTA
jgi:putative ABC transport system ATP-binding protein